MSNVPRIVLPFTMALVICPAMVSATGAADRPIDRIGAAVESLFQATNTAIVECPKEVMEGLAARGELRCGRTPLDLASFKGSLELSRIKLNEENAALIEPAGEWRDDGNLCARKFHCRGGEFTMIYSSTDRLVVASFPSQGSPTAPEDGPFMPGVDGVSLPKLIRKSDPDYPREARKEGRTAKVFLQAVIDVDGRVSKLRVLSCTLSDYGFEKAAMDAVRQWRYRPGLRDGEPVPVFFNIAVDFRIQN